MLRRFLSDEAGFIVSSELVLVATILVIGMVVGMSEVQHAVGQELSDVGTAIGRINQSYYYTGFKAAAADDIIKSRAAGSFFFDDPDVCDDTVFITGDPPTDESPLGP